MTHNDEFKTLVDKLEEISNELRKIGLLLSNKTTNKKIVRRKKKV